MPAASRAKLRAIDSILVRVWTRVRPTATATTRTALLQFLARSTKVFILIEKSLPKVEGFHAHGAYVAQIGGTQGREGKFESGVGGSVGHWLRLRSLVCHPQAECGAMLIECGGRWRYASC